MPGVRVRVQLISRPQNASPLSRVGVQLELISPPQNASSLGRVCNLYLLLRMPRL